MLFVKILFSAWLAKTKIPSVSMHHQTWIYANKIKNDDTYFYFLIFTTTFFSSFLSLPMREKYIFLFLLACLVIFLSFVFLHSYFTLLQAKTPNFSLKLEVCLWSKEQGMVVTLLLFIEILIWSEWNAIISYFKRFEGWQAKMMIWDEYLNMSKLEVDTEWPLSFYNY